MLLVVYLYLVTGSSKNPRKILKNRDAKGKKKAANNLNITDRK